ncbi:hypothetical protein BACCIP111899_03708 [Bacillus rhizoplanae]|uniref:Uncharacterized protein n=1 Tax=Bacillus rhizoplanae TaxID=2880966 RepID=A0ABM8YF64_9BACI|nr:hypothetical protein [Bacillus rhizoplanae]CAG9614475.1 hypothetical protein BACCIP111899_03708 [Bacillus rhizoplanae]
MSILINHTAIPSIFNPNLVKDTHKQPSNTKNKQKHFEGICCLLNTFNLGKKVNEILVNGTPLAVSNFTGFHFNTGLAIFIDGRGRIILVNCERIDAIVL